VLRPWQSLMTLHSLPPCTRAEDGFSRLPMYILQLGTQATRRGGGGSGSVADPPPLYRRTEPILPLPRNSCRLHAPSLPMEADSEPSAPPTTVSPSLSRNGFLEVGRAGGGGGGRPGEGSQRLNILLRPELLACWSRDSWQSSTLHLWVEGREGP